MRWPFRKRIRSRAIGGPVVIVLMLVSLPRLTYCSEASEELGTTALDGSTDFRFVFSNGMKLYIELRQHYADLAPKLIAEHSVESIQKTPWPHSFSDEEQDRILATISEPKHQRFFVSIPGADAASSAELAGIAALPSEDGGIAGLVGILRSPALTIPEAEAGHLRPVGVAYPCADGRDYAEPFVKSTEPPVDQCRKMLETIKANTSESSLETLECLRYNLKSQPDMIVLTAQIGNRTLLWCGSNADSDCTLVSVQAPEFWTQGGGVVLADDAEYDLARHDSQYWILPDLNRNGFNELFVRSTVSAVFEFQSEEPETTPGTTRLQFLREIYLGP